MNKERNRTY